LLHVPYLHDPDRSPYGNQIVQLYDILVIHPDAAIGNRLPNGGRIVGPVDSVPLPVEPQPAFSEDASGFVGFIDDGEGAFGCWGCWFTDILNTRHIAKGLFRWVFVDLHNYAPAER
jgi:hypothetical protein